MNSYLNRVMTTDPHRAHGDQRQIGRISAWKSGRGFGFIAPADGGADVFVHVHNVSGRLDLCTGERVSFEVGMDLRKGKPEATNVILIDD